MDGFEKFDPFRKPNWRQRRVIRLLSTLPVPRRPNGSDDRFVIKYYRFLAAAAAAGEDDKVESLHERWPVIGEAHHRYYSSDVESRQILEALLLTSETFSDIAARFGVEPAVVEWYEKLFFNVRDRMGATTWIMKTIAGSPEDRRASPDGLMTDCQRGYLYRLFAFCGGPMVLEALVTGFGGVTMPRSSEEVPDWLDNALTNTLLIRAAAAAATVEVHRKNAKRLMKLGMRMKAAKRRHPANPAAEKRREEHLAKALTSMSGWKTAAVLSPSGAATVSS